MISIDMAKINCPATWVYYSLANFPNQPDVYVLNVNKLLILNSRGSDLIYLYTGQDKVWK